MNNNFSNPLISIVIPTRNRWEDLQKALDSCLNQDYSPVEILVYDDASDENIAEKVKQKYPVAKVYRGKENVGQVCLRNKGFHDAQGEYIFSLDDDSYFADSHTITAVVKVLTKCPEIAAAALPYFEPKLNRSYFFNPQCPPDGNASEAIMSVANFTACAAALRKEAVTASGGYREGLFFGIEEGDLSIRLLEKGWTIVSIPVKPLIHLFSGIRDHQKFQYLTTRNSILITFLNVPSAYLLTSLIKTTVGLLWHGITVGKPILKLWAIINGYGLCMKFCKRRQPVSIKTWQKYQCLLKQAEPYVPGQAS
jgi:GT2 family glycosyltransferase